MTICHSNMDNVLEARNAIVEVEYFLGLPFGSLISNSRRREHVDARMVLMYHFYNGLDMTFEMAAAMFKRDHATAINAINNFKSLYSNDKPFKTYADRLFEIVGSDILTSKRSYLEQKIETYQKQITEMRAELERIKYVNV